MTSLPARLFKFTPRITSVIPRYKSTASGYAKEEYSADKQTHFGFENVSQDQKAEKVHGVFENVASSYDLMNDLMSGGVHRVWKDYFMSRIDLIFPSGDIAFRFIQHVLHSHRGGKTLRNSWEEPDDATSPSGSQKADDSLPPYEITVCDISQNMLDVGQTRAKELGYKGITWVCGDALKLPFPNDEFDCYTIAFGIRNVVDVEKESFKEMIEDVGFRNTSYLNLTFGVSAIHSGFKI
ncbi:2-methoxy-6-polyprenyl-1-4-benzoquinol methylase-like [Homarus americanus]|uniref:2-methoxy-6-polyprenyl-1-4-benzoquinol methylase-like n=1 Tax=Homarus americanus TaxID=6706 RepID=A0A8J5N8C3_HOMAM|nr:2-methoxy-6-polyprenyl-1-4-benzoquinol methylase-like [Homarus americanus]